MTHPKMLHNKGFTLIEVLLALFILIVAIISIIQLYPAGLNSSRLTKNEIKADNLLQSELENIQSFTYNNIANEPRSRFSDDQNNSYYKFEKQVEVVFIDQNLNNSINDLGMKKVTVTIYWPESGQNKTITSDLIIRK